MYKRKEKRQLGRISRKLAKFYVDTKINISQVPPHLFMGKSRASTCQSKIKIKCYRINTNTFCSMAKCTKEALKVSQVKNNKTS